jgi:hypothetical protein
MAATWAMNSLRSDPREALCYTIERELKTENLNRRSQRSQRGEAATTYGRTPWALVKSEV